MEINPMDWLPHSFSRSPAWRMLRAEYRVHEKTRPDPSVDDEWTEVALKLIRSPGAFGPGHPVQAAFALWTREHESRWLLEARLLTAQSFDEIAAACSLSTAAVEAYHELFFHVRPRLDARDWVMAMAVRSAPMNDFAGPQPAGIWKYAAFTGGPRVLEVVLAVTLGRPLPAWKSETFLKNPPLEEAYFRTKVKFTLAVLTARSDHRLGSLVELGEQLRALAAEAGFAVSADPLLPLMGEILSALGCPGSGVSESPNRPTVGKALKKRAPRPAPVSVQPTRGESREE
ncbi:unnamed protein product [Gemmataceae bacterium]|nr:unnamed protein product [Gemmataceae bacterium]VTT98778.1 unnamed protein product [Gemmataceae bacterium]